MTPFSSCPQSFPASGSFPKCWLYTSGSQSIGASASASSEYSGLISLRIDWFDLLAAQGILKRLENHHSSKTSVLQCSAFFMVQLSHLFMTTGKTIALTRLPFVGKVMSLIYNILSRFLTAFLPSCERKRLSKHLLISWLQSPFAVSLEPPKNKVCHCFHCFPIYLP